MPKQPMMPVQPWADDGPVVRIGERDPETGHVPVHLPKPRVSDPHFLSDLLAEWQAERPG